MSTKYKNVSDMVKRISKDEEFKRLFERDRFKRFWKNIFFIIKCRWDNMWRKKD